MHLVSYLKTIKIFVFLPWNNVRSALARWCRCLLVCDWPLLVVDVRERFFQSVVACDVLHVLQGYFFSIVLCWEANHTLEYCQICFAVRQWICVRDFSVVCSGTWRSERRHVESGCLKLTCAVLLWLVLLCRLLQCLEFTASSALNLLSVRVVYIACMASRMFVTIKWHNSCHHSVVFVTSVAYLSP